MSFIAIVFSSSVAYADASEPDIAAHWNATVPVYPDDPRVRTLVNVTAGPFIGDPFGSDVVVGEDGAVYWMANVHAGPLTARVRRLLLVKYSGEGERLWHRILVEDGKQYLGSAIAADERGNVYIAGTIASDGPRGARTQGFVVAFNAAGRHRWSYEFPQEDRDAISACRALAVQGDRLYLAGVVRGRVAPNARPGQVGVSSASMDGVVACLRADGRQLWIHQIQGSREETFQALDIALIGEDQVGLAVNYSRRGVGNRNSETEEQSALVMCFNRAGQPLWRTAVGKSLIPPAAGGERVGNYIVTLASGPAGNVYVVGINDIRGRGVEGGCFLARLSPAGEVQWANYLQRDNPVTSQLVVSRPVVDREGRVWLPGIVRVRGSEKPMLMRYTADGACDSLQHFSEGHRFQSCDALALDIETQSYTVTGRFDPVHSEVVPGQPGIRGYRISPAYFLARLDLAKGTQLLGGE